jgi:hypothetical protein
MKNAALQWVEQVRQALTRLLAVEDAPEYDIRWLIRRCEDTFLYPDDIQKASVAQLIKDLANFEREFPGLFAADLLAGPGAQ